MAKVINLASHSSYLQNSSLANRKYREVASVTKINEVPTAIQAYMQVLIYTLHIGYTNTIYAYIYKLKLSGTSYLIKLCMYVRTYAWLCSYIYASSLHKKFRSLKTFCLGFNRSNRLPNNFWACHKRTAQIPNF